MKNQYNQIILLHCFPVPYRNYLFELMQTEATNRGIKFEVLFFDSFDSSRPNWFFKSDELNYNNAFFKPIYKKGPVLHLNIDLLFYVLRNRKALVISGGVWSSMNSIILSLIIPNRFVGWDETNRNDFGSKQKNYLFFKRFLINRLRILAVPGLEAIRYYEDLIGSKGLVQKKILNLPNLINESILESLKNQRLRLNEDLTKEYPEIDLTKTIVYWPARFIEEKGIMNFLDVIDNKVLSKCQIILIGHGHLEKQITSLIYRKNFEKSIIVIKSTTYEKSIRFYAISDFVLMPSLADSNPLSLIEAIHSSLPLLISNRVGNYNEVLLEGENGFSFDPDNHADMYLKSFKMFNLHKNELDYMGRKSKFLANQYFNSQKVIRSFFDSI